ncbi:hypothetical protein RHGRI_031903 [Rhododendron griersonianum]|uniref:Uncharacterized protein n=1 Tax=Rhododendron griersonianum TaxID=479676 RepID=A0AAV6IC07_9ERIC|nr:hypothetical protein RHGRI_031903 [Rhododendron griersonianum]
MWLFWFGHSVAHSFNHGVAYMGSLLVLLSYLLWFFGVSLLLLILLVKVPLPFVSCWSCLSFYTSVGHAYKMNKRSDADCRGQIVAQ